MSRNLSGIRKEVEQLKHDAKKQRQSELELFIQTCGKLGLVHSREVLEAEWTRLNKLLNGFKGDAFATFSTLCSFQGINESDGQLRQRFDDMANSCPAL